LKAIPVHILRAVNLLVVLLVSLLVQLLYTQMEFLVLVVL
jgi:hypothetical protein